MVVATNGAAPIDATRRFSSLAALAFELHRSDRLFTGSQQESSILEQFSSNLRVPLRFPSFSFPNPSPTTPFPRPTDVAF
jgi:hypothetical protein